MIKGFRFTKNERGFSEGAFSFLRQTLIRATRYKFSPRITNPENVPKKGPCFIYGNHANYFDPFMINIPLIQEPTAGVMTRDQFHKTLPRIFMDGIGIVPTSKYVPEPGIIRSVIRMIDQRRMIVIFPEGGRRWDGRPKSIIETTLKLFWKMKIPVHPVQLHGSYLGWPRWADECRQSSIEMRYMKPLHASDFSDFESFAEACREQLNFEEYTPPEGTWPIKCKKPAAGIQRFLYRCPDSGINRSVFSPDGVRVFSRNSPMQYKMDKDSRLITSSGERVSIIDLFDKINAMPMVFEKPSERIILEKPGAQMYMVDDEHQLITLDRAHVELSENGLQLFMGAEKRMFSADEIRYTSIEQNHKLTITTVNETFQIDLSGYNALQWQLYINRLKAGEKPELTL